MSFSGNLSTVSFGDILQLVSTGKKTGALLLIRGQQEKRIYFRDGQVIYAGSDAAEEDRLGQLLIRRGKIAPDQLKAVLQKQRVAKRRLGEIIIEMRLIDPHELSEALRLQVEEIIYSLFVWGDGEFQFIESEAPPANSPLTEIDTTSVMMEGVRRFDEWSKIRDALPPAHTVLQICPAPIAAGGEISLSSEDLEMLALIDGRRRADEIMQSFTRGEYAAARSVYKLIELSIVEPAAHGEDERGDPEELGDVFDLVFKLYSHSLSRIHQEVTDLLGVGGERLFLRPAHRKIEPGLFDSLTGGDTESTRESFLRVAESIPVNLRLHKILSHTAILLQDRLKLVRDCLGDHVASRLAQAVQKEVAVLLAQKRSLADKYDIDREFAESLNMP